MKWPWEKNVSKEETRRLRGDLLRSVIELEDKSRELNRKVRESPIQDMLQQMLLKLDEGRRE